MLLVACPPIATGTAAPLDYEEAPIQYSDATPDTVISRLQKEIEAGNHVLPAEGEQGYLKALLQYLDVPESSQMLTFLKSSLQRPLIEPQNPRALYFGDDAYVGYVPGGIIELIVPDPRLGMVFYTLDDHDGAPRIQRQVSRCMTCHASSRTKNIPGLQIRSMYTDPSGEPVLSAGSFRTDHSSPLETRWGGWFVSGTHGEVEHLGNMQLPNKKRPRQKVVNTSGTNVTDLAKFTDLSKNLTADSDLVALMVFEHQMDAHNWMVRANYAYQIDLHRGESEAVTAQWKKEADALVEHLLLLSEAKLPYPVQGTSNFANEFSQRGNLSANGHSLREFDLKTRMFKYPCSYTIESQLFRSLPKPVRQYTLEKIQGALASPEEFGWEEPLARYTPEQRAVAAQIVRQAESTEEAE
ncbi:hypothetical protein GCM10023155_25110 [Bremerella cremea]